MPTSKLRLKNAEGKELVTVCLETGKVETHTDEGVEEAAKAFWECVALVRASFTGYEDFVIQGGAQAGTIIGVLDDCPKSKPGDIVFNAGSASEDSDGGDVTVHRGDLPLKDIEPSLMTKGNAVASQPHHANTKPKP